ncbi:ABC transporter substrate-binding protein [Sphingosinicella sp.]|uniref:ABC transporter substrate-binding protein n=1 Tax=Sphingosinicella sp. TaxID=1917971 RepID=UPI0040378011
MLLSICAALALGACGDTRGGPVAVSAIGAPPRLANPNLQPLDPPSAFLAEAVAQGLVRFDAAGEIEPALAQSWIVSDDGLRYTFRIRRASWPDGSRITAEQVAGRLRATASRPSRNALKPVLGGIESITAMTDAVLEIALRGPRPNLLQLLAQPEMAVIFGGMGSGPYQIGGTSGGAPLLSLPPGEDGEPAAGPSILLRGEGAALAVARFARGEAELVVGGTIGDLPVARAANQPNARLLLDPVQGLFGLSFASREGPLGDAAVRRAMSMALDREALVAALNVRGLEARATLTPAGLGELPRPFAPEWTTLPLPERIAQARAAIAALNLAAPLRVRVAMPDGPGYRIAFAYLRRDWRAIGVEAARVPANAPAAELRLIDAVAPAVLATWYLRHFTCDAARICDAEADRALQDARAARTLAERRLHLARADQILSGLTPYIPLAGPVRWSLVGQRLTGFRPNMFGRHAPGELIAQRF